MHPFSGEVLNLYNSNDTEISKILVTNRILMKKINIPKKVISEADVDSIREVFKKLPVSFQRMAIGLYVDFQNDSKYFVSILNVSLVCLSHF